MGWSRATVISVAKRTGYPVIEAWSGHNKGSMGTVYGPMLHHTGTSKTAPGDYPTLKVVRDGRPGLENSLCMYGLGRSGTIYCINNNISWHAGAGSWNGEKDGNGHFAGIEAESSGGGEWTEAQLDSYQKLTASILLETGRGLDWMPRHAEWALPKGRKTDTGGINMAVFKAKVGQYLANPALLGVKGSVDDMYDEKARSELVGRLDQQVIPLLNNVLVRLDEQRPFYLYRLNDQNDPSYGLVVLAGEGMWWGLPNPDYIGLIQHYRLAGNMIAVDNAAQWGFIKMMWELKAPRVDTQAVVDRLNAAALQLDEDDLRMIADAVNDEDDRRDRDDDTETGVLS